MKITILVFLFYLDTRFSEAVFFKCPIHQLHFEKILGYRPSITKFSHLLYRGYPENLTNTINIKCWEICKSDRDCTSYVLFFTTSECYGFTTNSRSPNYDILDDNIELISDSNSVYFEKICLDVPLSCTDKLWPIVRIPGSSLIGQGYKQINTLVSRHECAQKCINEMEFQCLSASFSVSRKNNLNRYGIDRIRAGEDYGMCILSREDKLNQPDSFRVASPDEEYIENQCIERASSNVFCSYEQYTNSNFIYSDIEQKGLTQKQCQERCSEENRFYCQGVSYFDTNTENSRCYFHSEDTISLGPRSIKFQLHGIYMRRVKCLNLTVICQNDVMTVRYSPTNWFRGRMFVNAHAEECSIEGQGTGLVELRIPIGNEIQENRCGIIRAYEINEQPWNRSLISTLLVIQKNPLIQTQGDRLIKVGCILNNITNTEGVPDDIALGSSIEFTNSLPPSEGALALNTTIELPSVNMKIIDLNEQLETNDVQLGQNLEFILSVDPADSPYDIRAVNLIARSGSGQNSIQLLDDRGCPRDVSVFPALKKIITPDSRTLRARFHAFKFVESSGVHFELIIHFCLNECPPVECRRGIKSYGKRRKRKRREVTNVSNIVNRPTPPINFPNITTTTTTTTTSSTIGPIKFPDPVSYKIIKIRNSSNETILPANSDLESSNEHNSNNANNQLNVDLNEQIYQRVFSEFTQSTTEHIKHLSEKEKNASIEQTSRNNFTDFKRILKNVAELPLKLELNVHSPKIGESESLIYGENNQILVAGIDLEKENNMICMTPSILIIVLLFWLVLQIVLMTGCCVLIKKYRKLAELEDDRKSLNRIHQSLEFDSLNRRVRFADQGGISSPPPPSHVMYN